MKCSPLLALTLALAGTLLVAAERPLSPFQTAAFATLTLDQAIAMALCQNPDVLNAKQEIERLKGHVIEVRSQALPQVALTATYQQEDRGLVNSQSTSSGGTTRATTQATPTPVPSPTPVANPSASASPSASPTPTPSVFVQNKTWEITVQATQVIYAGGGIRAAIAMAKFSEQSAFFKLIDTGNTVIANVRTQFYQVLVNRALIKVQEESVGLLRSQLKDQKERLEAGTVPRFNVLQAEVALANAIPNLIQAKNNYHISALQLAKTLGFDTNHLAAQCEPFFAIGELTIPEPGMGLPCALQVARECNPSLKAQRLDISVELQDILVQKAGYKPTVTANSGYTIENSALSKDLGDTLNGWFFGVQGTWAIFDGLQTYGKVKQAKARLQEAKIKYDDTLQQVDLQVQQAWANLLQAKETITSGQATVTQATEAVRLARERLAAGAGTQLDVLNATVQLTQAETTELQARNSYNAALAEFDRATAVSTKYAEPFPDPLKKKVQFSDLKPAKKEDKQRAP